MGIVYNPTLFESVGLPLNNYMLSPHGNKLDRWVYADTPETRFAGYMGGVFLHKILELHGPAAYILLSCRFAHWDVPDGTILVIGRWRVALGRDPA